MPDRSCFPLLASSLNLLIEPNLWQQQSLILLSSCGASWCLLSRRKARRDFQQTSKADKRPSYSNVTSFSPQLPCSNPRCFTEARRRNLADCTRPAAQRGADPRCAACLQFGSRPKKESAWVSGVGRFCCGARSVSFSTHLVGDLVRLLFLDQSRKSNSVQLIRSASSRCIVSYRFSLVDFSAKPQIRR